MPTFVELFAGGGLMRAGLGAGWSCLYANDWSAPKAETYRANYGDAELREKDIRQVSADELPKADLLWASFPCQDHSSAGARSGFADGTRGKLVFHLLDLLEQVGVRGNAPRIIALENVLGLVSAEGGEDFERLLTGLVSIGYRVGALAIDAAHWLPHSRPRVFIVALAAGMPIPARLTQRRPSGPWYPKSLVRALGTHPPAVARNLLWWMLPEPPPRTMKLRDIVDTFGTAGEKWRPPENVAALLATCRPDDLERLAGARAAGQPVYGTAGLKRWDRTKQQGRSLLLRTDGVVSCLMGKPDLHYCQLLRVDGDWASIRPFTIPEFGRLMGLPADYRMPPTVRRAAKLSGEGVAVPVVRWLAAHLLEPLAAAEQVPVSAVPPEPRRPVRARKEIQVASQPGARLKQKSIGTTAYLLPGESARVHELAAKVGVSVHELLMQGLDRMFMGRGLAPVLRIPKTQRGRGVRRKGEDDIARLPSRHGRNHDRHHLRPRTEVTGGMGPYFAGCRTTDVGAEAVSSAWHWADRLRWRSEDQPTPKLEAEL